MRRPIAHPQLTYRIALSGQMQREIAAKADITEWKMTAILRGWRSPSADERRRLASVLDVDEADLFPNLDPLDDAEPIGAARK